MAVPPAAPQISQPPTRLKLSSPAEVLAAVPYLIGFAPQSSVVVLCLRGKQLGLTMRLDLGLSPAEMQQILLERVHADGADRALIVLYDPPPGAPRPGSAMARQLMRAFRREGINVQDAMGVGDGRFWSYVCRNSTCCPPQGRPVPVSGGADHSKVAATFVSHGSAPLASREEVCATLEPVTGEQRAELMTCLESALANPSANPVQRWWKVVSRYTESPPRPGSTLALPEAARLIAGLADSDVRDEVISWTVGESVVGVLAVLRELAPLALPPFDTQILAALAWAAYSFGDGALASMALERAIHADPQHKLAGLLAMALETGIAPEQLRTITGELADTLSADSDGPDFSAGIPRWSPGGR